MKGTLKERFEAKVMPEPMSGCWLWTGGMASSGYGMIGISTSRSVPAHRVSYNLYKGEIPKDILVCHTCDNRICVNPDHLFLGTHQDNTKDMWNKGRQKRTNIPFGERIAKSKLKTAQVIEIKRLSNIGVQGKVLAKFYGVTPAAISFILNGRNWKHLSAVNQEDPII